MTDSSSKRVGGNIRFRPMHKEPKHQTHVATHTLSETAHKPPTQTQIYLRSIRGTTSSDHLKSGLAVTGQEVEPIINT